MDKDLSIVNKLTDQISDSQVNKGVSQDIASFYIGNESAVSASVAKSEIDTTLESSKLRISQAIESLGMDIDYSDEAIALAAGAGVLAVVGSESATITSPTRSKNTLVIASGDSAEVPEHSLEVFDAKDPAKNVTFAESFNLSMAGGDSISNAVFPIVALQPTDSGVIQQAKLLYTHTSKTHNIEGDPIEYFKRNRNVIRAAIDPAIIDLDETLLIPVVRPENTDKFVDDADVPHVTPETTNEAFAGVTTGYINKDIEVSLISLSQTDTMLADGTVDSTDSVDRDMRLGSLAFKSGDDIFAVDMAGIPSAAFLPASFEEQHMLHMNLDAKTIMLNTKSRRIDGSSFTTALNYGELNDGTIQLRVRGGGRVNTQSSTAYVSVTKLELVSVSMANGTKVAEDDAIFTDIQAVVDAAEFLGWYPDGRRSNTNLRNEGVIVDSIVMVEVSEVGYRAPLTVLRPVNKEKSNSDLTDLLRLNKVALDNDAIDTMIYGFNLTEAFGNNHTTADIAGIGRHYIKPTSTEVTIDVKTDIINSIESGKRIKDVAAAMLDIYRDVALKIYVDSEYGAALEYLSSGVSINGPRVLVKIVADQRVAAVLASANLEDDMFKYVICPTVRGDMKKTSFVTLSPIGSAPTHPLNFGFTEMAPSVVLDGRMTRNGRNSNALMSIPRHKKVLSSMIIGKVNVENIQDAYRKIV